jgi:tRNA(Ile)-lysidine synthase
MTGGGERSGPSVAQLRLISHNAIADELELRGIDCLELLGRCAFPSSDATDGPFNAAVSGGQDSFALVVLAKLAGLSVVAHHVDHQLRPESSSEADLIAQQLERLEVPLVRHRVKVELGPNLEERARTARFAVLPPGIATGHTLDDQAETLLINLMRGSGTGGLGAMRPSARHPILGVRRTETLIISRAVGLDPLIDPSNADLTILRNRVRRELVPLMADISRRDVAPLLARTADRLRTDDDLITRLLSSIEIASLRDLRPLEDEIVARFLRERIREVTGLTLSLSHTRDVVAVARGRQSGISLPRGVQLSRRKGKLQLSNERGEILWELM